MLISKEEWSGIVLLDRENSDSDRVIPLKGRLLEACHDVSSNVVELTVTAGKGGDSQGRVVILGPQQLVAFNQHTGIYFQETAVLDELAPGLLQGWKECYPA